MILINNPDKSVWAELLKRPMMNTESLHETVRSILNQIKNEGDEAVLRYEETFDHVRLESLVVTEEEIQEAESLVSDELKKAILLAKSNIAPWVGHKNAAQVLALYSKALFCSLVYFAAKLLWHVKKINQ